MLAAVSRSIMGASRGLRRWFGRRKINWPRLFSSVRVGWIIMTYWADRGCSIWREDVEVQWSHFALPNWRVRMAGQGAGQGPAGAAAVVALIWKDPPSDLFRQSFLTFPVGFMCWEVHTLASLTICTVAILRLISSLQIQSRSYGNAAEMSFDHDLLLTANLILPLSTKFMHLRVSPALRIRLAKLFVGPVDANCLS